MLNTDRVSGAVSYCCKKAPCVISDNLGREKDGKCLELLWANGRYWCGLMLDAPKKYERNEQWYMSALCAGEGCCSPLNSDRKAMILRAEDRKYKERICTTD